MVERFTPAVIPSDNGKFVWYSDYEALEAKLAALVEIAEKSQAWLEPTAHSNPQSDSIYRKLKAAIADAKGGK